MVISNWWSVSLSVKWWRFEEIRPSLLVPIYLMKSLRALLNTDVVLATTPPMPKSEQNLWDKYGIIRKYDYLFSYIFTTVRKAYISSPEFQPLGCKCLLLGNASWCIEGVIMSLQRSIHLALKLSRELLEVLNDPAVLVSDAGIGWRGYNEPPTVCTFGSETVLRVIEVLNDPAVLVSDAGTGWALFLDSGQVRH